MRRPQQPQSHQQQSEIYSIPYSLDANELFYRHYKEHSSAVGLTLPTLHEQPRSPSCESVDPWRAPVSVLLSSSSANAGDAQSTCYSQHQHLTGSSRSIASRTEVPLHLDEPCDKQQRNLCTMWCSSKFEARWIIDGFCIITVIALLFIIELGWMPITLMRAGFFCDDPSIAYRYDGDTISVTMLLSICIFVPLLAMWAMESCCCLCPDNLTETGLGAKSRRAFRHAWVWYREYLLGLVLALLIVEIAKVMVNEPRPHFLDTCKPDVMQAPEGCKAVASPSGYIEEFKCTNTEKSDYSIRDSTKSFPSGHAALSVYSAIFLIWFMQRRMPGVPRNAPSRYLRPYLQIICLSWAMTCSFTRVTDHRHHPHDVLAGIFLGVVTAIITIRNFCGNFWPGYCAARLREESASVGGSSGERGGPVLSPNGIDDRRENGHLMGGSGNRQHHQSVRRLLSSVSSYSGSIATDEPLREVTPS